MCALRSTYWAVTSCPWFADESTVPSCESWTIALSKLAAGTRTVNDPLSPPSVEEERIEPPFTAAMCATEPAFALKVPSSIVIAICPSRMIFDRSVGAASDDPLDPPCWIFGWVVPVVDPVSFTDPAT
jgi:hypothetical protein